MAPCLKRWSQENIIHMWPLYQLAGHLWQTLFLASGIPVLFRYQVAICFREPGRGNESCFGLSFEANHSNSISFTSDWFWQGPEMTYDLMRGARKSARCSERFPCSCRFFFFFSHERKAKRTAKTPSSDRVMLLNKLILEWPKFWTPGLVSDNTHPCWLNQFLLDFPLLIVKSIDDKAPDPEQPIKKLGRGTWVAQ